MMAKSKNVQLSRRERQVMDIVYALGEATAAEITERMEDGPTNAAVRFVLRTLEEKGHLTHSKEGVRFIHRPTVSRGRAQKSALNHVLTTFFDGSTELAVSAMLELQSSSLSRDELDRIAEVVEQMKRKGL